MIPVHWIVLAVIFAFAAGWLLRGDCDEQRQDQDAHKSHVREDT